MRDRETEISSELAEASKALVNMQKQHMIGLPIEPPKDKQNAVLQEGSTTLTAGAKKSFQDQQNLINLGLLTSKVPKT